MIPSDHFVMFYNEIFKYIDARNGLDAYYQAISEHQETHCLKMYQEQGIKGIYEYYLKIRKEENCGVDMELTDDGHGIMLLFTMCASITKAMDSDAGACEKYCLHCPGWSGRIYKKAGLFYVKDLMGPLVPKCQTWGYDRLDLAMAKYRQLVAEGRTQWLWVNFPVDGPGHVI